MKSESNNNSDPHRLVFNFVDKIDLNGSDKHIALSNIKQLLDKAMEDIKIYSVETRNIQRGLAQAGYYLARLNKFDICHRLVKSLFYEP